MPKLHIKKEDVEITLLDEQNIQKQFNNLSDSLSTVATTGSYNDLTNKPTIDSQLSTTSKNSVQNKIITNALSDKVNTSSLSTVATSGSYDDLTDKPTIPSDIEDLNPSTTTFTITYTDDTTEDVEVVIIPSNSGGA